MYTSHDVLIEGVNMIKWHLFWSFDAWWNLKIGEWPLMQWHKSICKHKVQVFWHMSYTAWLRCTLEPKIDKILQTYKESKGKIKIDLNSRFPEELKLWLAASLLPLCLRPLVEFTHFSRCYSHYLEQSLKAKGRHHFKC